MKRFVVLFVAALLVALPVTANTGWTKTYGGELYDNGCSVEQTSDGGYIIAGQTYSFGEGDADGWLLKTDSKGDTLWSRTYGGAGYDDAAFIRQTSDGGYIIAGTKTSVEEDRDVWLLKTDSLGDILWEKCHGGEDHDYGWCVQETSDGGYIIGGHRDNPKAACGGWDMWLLKTDPLGDTVWTRTFFRGDPPFGVATAYYVQETSDGGYIAVGDLADVPCWDLYLVKVNSDGDSLWAVTYDFLGYDDRGYCIQETCDGNYIITGFAEKDHLTDAEIWLLKINSQGDTLWTRTFGGEKFDGGLFVSTTTDGGYIIAGLKDYFKPAWSDLWLIKTDEEGNEVWNRTYGKDGTENDWAYCVRETSDRGFIITGGTESWGSGGYDLWLVKTDSLGLVDAVEEEPPVTPVTQQPDWQVTPIGQRIVLQYKDMHQGFSASVFDASGRKVDEIHETDASGTIFWGEKQTSGVYFIKVDAETPISTLKVILIN